MTFHHLDSQGRARMVDVGGKDVTARRAIASARVRVSPETLDAIVRGELAKGDALATARIAGILGAKHTPDLIPLCHPIALDHVRVEVEPDPAAGCVRITVEASVQARTGVEMEALTGAAVAGLALIDMVKSRDREARIEEVRLELKEGGKSGRWTRESGA